MTRFPRNIHRPPPGPHPCPVKPFKKYVVKKGDTLRNILIKKLGMSEKSVTNLISILGKKADTIYPGQKILYFKKGGKNVLHSIEGFPFKHGMNY